MAKTVSVSKFSEWKGLDRIALTVHEMKCIWRETGKDDYGIDGEIQVVVPKADGEGFETTDGYIKVQSKSGASYVKQDTPDSFSTPVDRNDLDSWHASTYPVFFIVYHPSEDKLYWKEVKTYIRETPDVFHPPTRIVFSKATDVFDSTCLERVHKIGGTTPTRVSYQQKERLYSNLLLVRRGPTVIYSAPTTYKTTMAVRDALDRPAAPFCIQDGSLFTLANLHNPRSFLRPFVDVGGIEEHGAQEWAKLYERDYVYLLNQLLGQHLRDCGLRYSRAYQRNYFPKDEGSTKMVRRNWFNIRTGRQVPYRTVARYFEYGADRFWRHLAVNMRFLRAGETWFLQLNPKYFFTGDGREPYASDRVGTLTTKLKAREYNNHVLNHILFWCDVMSQHEPVITLCLFRRKPVMVIEKEPCSDIARFAIPDDPAIYEDEDTTQLSFTSLLAQTADEEEEDWVEEDDEH